MIRYFKLCLLLNISFTAHSSSYDFVRDGQLSSSSQTQPVFQNGQDQNDNDTLYRLGLLYRADQDYSHAGYWFGQAAARGHAQAQNDLGVLYCCGHGVMQNYNTARQWYEQAASQGYVPAQSNLGNLYYYGHGVVQNYDTARQWYQQAADQNAQTHLLRIANMYLNIPGL